MFLSARSARTLSVAIVPGGRPRAEAGGDEINDVLHGGTRTEHPRYANRLQRRQVGIRDDAAEHHEHVGEPFFAKEVHQTRADRVVRARQNGQADDIGIFLKRRGDNLFWRLTEACVDHFHARIAQGARDDLGPPVMAVEPGLRDDDSDFLHGNWNLNVRLDYRLFVVFAPHVSQRVAHLADRRIRADGVEQRGHRILRSSGDLSEPIERAPHAYCIPRTSKPIDLCQLVRGGAFINLQNRHDVVAPTSELIDPDDHLLTSLDLLLKAISTFGDLALREPALDRSDHAPDVVDRPEILLSFGFEVAGQAFDEIGAPEWIDSCGDPGFAGEYLLRPQGERRRLCRRERERLVE